MFIRALRRPLAGLSAWGRFQRRRAEVARLFEEELRRRRAEPAPREDVMSLLMEARGDDGAALSDSELFENMMNLLAAGHETSASALAWALGHVHRDGAVLARLGDELAPLRASRRDPEAITRLPYLTAVCAETLRVTPVAPMIGRTLRDGFVLQGYTLPPGISIGISILGVHRRPDLYPEPARFLPDRFLGGREYAPYEYLPFGGGAKRCLGATFASYEMKLILATVLSTHRLRLVDDAAIGAVVRNTTVGPRGGVAMSITGAAGG
jgi:cytochrome P450